MAVYRYDSGYRFLADSADDGEGGRFPRIARRIGNFMYAMFISPIESGMGVISPSTRDETLAASSRLATLVQENHDRFGLPLE